MKSMEQNRASDGFILLRYAWRNEEKPDHLVIDEILPDGSFTHELLVRVNCGKLCCGEFIKVEHLPEHTPDTNHEMVVLRTPTQDFTAEVLEKREGGHIEEDVIESWTQVLTPRVELTPGEDGRRLKYGEVEKFVNDEDYDVVIEVI